MSLWRRKNCRTQNTLHPALNILQVCRLTPTWGIDLFKQISLAYENHVVTTVFLSGKSAPELSKHYHGNVIFFEIDHKKPGWRLNAAYKIWKLCRATQFNMVICHHYKPTVIMDWVSYFSKINHYFSVHHNMGNLRRIVRRLYTRFSLKRKWQFIAVSDGVTRDLIGAKAGLSTLQVHTIYNAIMLEDLLSKQLSRTAAREKLNLQSHHFVFGTIGRLVASKGHLLLINAFANVHHNLPDAILVIIGAGPLEASLQSHIESLGLRNKVMIHSNYAKHAGDLIRAFDAFVFPSIKEGFGLALLEAMSAKLPIIASDRGGIPEVVGETGLTVPLCEEELGKTLKILYHLSEQDRSKIGLAGYERLCQKFLQSHFKTALTTLIHPR